MAAAGSKRRCPYTREFLQLMMPMVGESILGLWLALELAPGLVNVPLIKAALVIFSVVEIRLIVAAFRIYTPRSG